MNDKLTKAIDELKMIIESNAGKGIELDMNYHVAILEIDEHRRRLQANNEIVDCIPNDVYWDFIASHWHGWLNYDHFQCESNPKWDYYVSIGEFWIPLFKQEFPIPTKKYDYDVMQLCEIAYIAGNLFQMGEVAFESGDLEAIFHDVYVPILEEWSHGVENKIFTDDEEEGYIGAYANRRLIELYGVK